MKTGNCKNSPPPCKTALNKISHVRSELGRLYRLALKDDLDARKLNSLIICLREIAHCIETSVLEKRVEALEETKPESITEEINYL
jgi:hypothetical protein